MDFSHLKIDSLTFRGNDFVFTPTTYAGDVTAGSFNEKSGFSLKTLQTNFAYSDTGATLKNLLVQTDKTTIMDNIAVAYPSIEAVTKDIGKLYLDANFVRSDLAVKDILILAPQLQANLKGNETAVLHVNARVKGYVNNLTIPQLQVTGIGNTAVSMSGTIKGLPDASKAVYNFDIANFQTTKADILKFIPPGTIPATVRIPDVMKVSGTFKGLATNFTTDMLLQTNKGSARVAGFVNSNNETYNLKGSLNNVDVGYLAKQDTLVGKVTMSFAANGRGFTPAKMVTKASAKVQSAYVMGYNYQNLDLTASVNRGQSVIDATMADKSLAFHLNGEALIDDKFATNIKLRLLLDSILLQPLGFAGTDLRIHGTVIADIPTSDINAPQGNVQINDLLVYNDGQRYKADSIEVNASHSDTGNVITLTSQIATASLRGKYNLATMGPAAMQLINKYYSLGIKDSALSNDQWTLDARIIPDSMLYTFAPSLVGTDTIKLAANFDGSAAKMNMLINAPKIQMGTQVLDSLTITAGNDADKFDYRASLNSAGSKAFRIEKTNLDGYIANNELFAKINIKDGKQKDKYQLGLKAVQEANGAVKANLSDSLMLDYDNWNVDNSNYIHYDSTGIIVHNFSISNNGQSLSINSEAENVAAPININLKNFHIKTLTNLADQESLNIDGNINGGLIVKNAMTSPVFTTDIVIDTLTLNRDTLGTITVKVDNETANAYNADVAITGNGNDIRLGGKYYTGESRMDMKFDVNNFNLSTLVPVSFGAVREADGSLKGGVVIKGTTTKPELDGSLKFENANITPQASGEKLHLSDEAIVIKSPDIVFNNFTLVDSAGNKAIVDGKITSPDFTTFNFDLALTAKNFRALTAPPKQNPMYYGDLNMDADVTVKGTLTAPIINADLKINKATNIAFVLPSTNPEIEGREGVVQFVDMYGGNTDSLLKAAIDTLNSFPAFAGMDVSGTLTSDTAAQITLVIDERSGDALKIRGKADLAGGIDKSGKISLTGTYELQSGSYQLSLSLLKRQFIIQPGSLITWNGDPLSATADITAVYVANTQPVNLLQSELSYLNTSDVNKYKAKVPFNVLLKMKGELLKPQISFGIELPADQQSKWEDVQTKLEQIQRDETELNKQVFALLLLGRFIQENPLANAAEGTSLATTAKSSVSRILAEQLNNLAGSLIKGVDLNFGVTAEDDFTSGTRQSRTDLTVGVSKNLLNDRLRVSVGSNFELEGPANTNQATSNIAGDVAADYLLSKDGRYTLRAYRRNRYEGVIEGQVVESGVSFIFTFDFNEFKQIFNKKTEEQKILEKAEREKRKADKKDKSNSK